MYSCTEYEEIKDVDLFISNYALSECDLPTQMHITIRLSRIQNMFI